MKEIRECFRTGSVIEIRYVGGGEKSLPVQSIGAGISWPVTASYYCSFLAKANAPDSDGIYKIHLIQEIEENLPTEFHKAIAENSSKLLCRSFFAPIAEDNFDHYNALKDYLNSRGLEMVGIFPPAITNFSAGIRFVMQLSKEGKLDLSKDSLLAQQLGQMTGEALQGINQHEFNSAQSLVNVISYFHQKPVAVPETVKSGWRYNE